MSKLHKATYCTQAANNIDQGKGKPTAQSHTGKRNLHNRKELPVGWKAHGTKLPATHTLKFYWNQVQYLV